MKLNFVSRCSLAVFLLGIASAVSAATTIQLEVDARELPRKLIHSRIEIPARSGKLALWYPKWIPGVHGPVGPIQNMGGFALENEDGKRIEWKRDDVELYRFNCDVPGGTKRAIVKLDYICNQPSVNSIGVDCFGFPQLGVINWNTCLVYPDGPTSDEITVELKLRLPEGWKWGSALELDKEDAGWLIFKPLSLYHLLDSPLIAGENLRTLALGGKDGRETSLHLVSEAPSAIQVEDKVHGYLKSLVAESEALFGAVHYPEYHFLLTCSDLVPSMGLEHHTSSLNAIGERDLVEEDKRKGWPAYLLPHEFMHSWCGKYRRPAGMATANYQIPQQFNLLWVYEGLAQYLGEILTVRCGLLTKDEYVERLVQTIDWSTHQTGRKWRSLEDTAVSTYRLRGGSENWPNLRRNQDYYDDGLLFWLEADARIRTATDGRQSLDDFCRKFMGAPATGGMVKPYDTAEVISILSDLAKTDWKKLIDERINRPQTEANLDYAGMLGYRLQYSSKPSKFLTQREKDREGVNANDSLGLSFGDTGRIVGIVPGMAGDKAGLAPGTMVQGVNGKKFSPQRMKDAIADSVTTRKIELLLLEGDSFRTVTLDYADGPKYLELVRDESKPDLLGEILKPKAVAEAKK